MSLQGPLFAPTHRDEYYSIVGARYNDAREEATKIANSKSIRMAVEFFKPVHFGAAWVTRGYKLPTGDTQKTLLSNVAFFPYGILNLLDASNVCCMDYMKWWLGAKTDYVGDWFTLPVCYFDEKQGAYKGNLAHYNFRGDETFTFNVHSQCTPEEVDAWLLAFIALPATLKESLITTA